MFIVKNKNFFLLLSVILIALSFYSISTYGLKKSIDFTGGAKVVVSFSPNSPNENFIKDSLKKDFGDVEVLPETNGSFRILLRDMKETDYPKLRQDLSGPSLNSGSSTSSNPNFTEFSMVGPTVSKEIVSSAIWGI